MNIREELLRDQIHFKEQALRISEFAVSTESNFKELINCFLSDEVRLAQRAAWSVSWAARKKPEMIQPYVHSLVNQLGRKDVHDAVIRNSLRILEDIDIPEEFHGKVMSTCFDYIQTRETPVAVKAFSLHILYIFSKIYPEIRNELKLIIQENIEYETAAFKSRGKKILAKI
ncbi:hypothetical protein [Dyadobacter psychrotolerans]|uniref:HEAT repeat domain-containing protein n=1 Tax=Dyadobacter psychrotolerans TaxID=2541721 RepID=A0A4R5DS89_9BACT|nr:hypothetical protein [Dyadobacter psychrotolerans]TDE16597.1 hypothetical protein E0F88_10200 [Dyadobacter psychrotolerans]